MNKLLSDEEREMANRLTGIAIRNAIATEMLKRYLEDEEVRKKIINYLKRGD